MNKYKTLYFQLIRFTPFALLDILPTNFFVSFLLLKFLLIIYLKLGRNENNLV